MKTRELKFRVWCNKRNLFLIKGDLVKDFLTENDFEFRTYIVESDLIWQQYTGFKDKNGNEIYDGDVVKIVYEGKLTEVYFDYTLGSFRLKDNTSKSYPTTTYRFDESNNPIGLINVFDEVVGNIFETPGLLK